MKDKQSSVRYMTQLLMSLLTSSSSPVFSRSNVLVLTLLNTSSRASQFRKSSLTAEITVRSSCSCITWQSDVNLHYSGLSKRAITLTPAMVEYAWWVLDVTGEHACWWIQSTQKIAISLLRVCSSVLCDSYSLYSPTEIWISWGWGFP